MKSNDHNHTQDGGKVSVFPIVAGFSPALSLSEELQNKITAMESCRGRNHPLEEFRSWLKEAGLLWDGLGIQVAGTNGKGSVTRWLDLMLEEQGKSVLSFTSPHLLSHFERISLNQSPIPAEDWEEIYDKWQPFFAEKEMTMFEMDLWMALAYAKQVSPDVLILEVGMGGERDATTALDYDLSLITNIGMDHMAYLGNTKEEIAKAKAGIIKENIPVFTTEKDSACLRVIENRAKELHAPFKSVSAWDQNWHEALPAYQKDNFALALAGAKKLGFEIDAATIRKIQEQFIWPARFMTLKTDPWIVLDGAHNLPGIEALCSSIYASQFDQVFFSVLADKQALEMIALLQTKVPVIKLVHFDTYRLADLEQLSKQTGLEILSFDEMIGQLKTTRVNTLICGSLYFAGAVLEAWKDIES